MPRVGIRCVVAVAIATCSVGALLAAGGPAAAAPQGLRVLAADEATGFRDGNTVFADLPMYLASYGQATEFRFGRASYGEPITGEVVTIVDGERTSRPIPRRLIDGFDGLRNGLRVTVETTDGEVVSRAHLPLCPGDRQRVDPNGPDALTYPYACGGAGFFTLGMVYGIEAGWAASVSSFLNFQGADDEYTVKVRINRRVARFLGIPKRQRRATVALEVSDFTGGRTPVAGASGPQPAESAVTVPRPVGTTRGGAVPQGALPDLVSLPAWGLYIQNESFDGQVNRDRLYFSATEWNAGPGALVVEGFRRNGTELMDAYQIFYRGSRPVGSEQVGTLEYHNAPEHNHWHFLDFAAYDLVAPTSDTVLAESGKQSWCLAPTDAIDLRIPTAEYRPGIVGLSTSCGSPSALWIREVLQTGWGDTYAGYQIQAIDITDVPNGTYRIRIVSNPDNNLREVTLDNNVAYRTITLGGTPGSRTVTAPPVFGIDTEGTPPVG